MDALTQKKYDAHNYTREWYNMMVRIWRDKMDLLGVLDTGALRGSASGGGFNANGFDLQAVFQFLQYGIYVDAGVGKGYKHGNPGDLKFLDPTYRYEHHLGKARQEKPWFSPSWYISVEVLKDKLSQILGEAFSGLFDDLTDRERR